MGWTGGSVGVVGGGVCEAGLGDGVEGRHFVGGLEGGIRFSALYMQYVGVLR